MSRPPAPFAAHLGAAEPIAWASVDLTETGFGDAVVVATATELLVIEAGGVRTRVPLAPLALEERIGHAILFQESGGELARATPERFGALSTLTDAVARWLAAGERTAAATHAPDPCPVCGASRDAGRCPACRRWDRTARRLASELAPFAGPLSAAGALLGAATLVGLAPPFLTKTLVDEVLAPGASPAALARVVGAMAGLLLAAQAIQYLRRLVESHLHGGLSHALRVRAFEAAAHLSLSDVARISPAGLAQVVAGDTAEVVTLLVHHSMTGLSNGLMVAGIVGALVWMAPALALLVLVPAPFALAAVWVLSRRGRLLVTRGWIEKLLVSQRAQALAQGFRVVKAFGAERRVVESFAGQSSSARLWDHRLTMHDGRYAPLLALISGAGSLLIWSYGGWLVLHGRLGIGSLVAYLGYLSLLYGHLQALGGLTSAWPRAWAAAEHYLELVDTVPAVRPPARPAPRTQVSGAVTLERVSFSYVPGRQVLADVDLAIAAGEMVGLVGRSGSGKSTLVNLIARFYDPTRGRILLDGVPLTDLDPAVLRRAIGVVLQTPFVFDGTVLENLRLGAPDATPRQVCEAAERAQVHEVILALPDGYDTRLSERPALSAGELQRLTIARALLSDPRLLILDEATASLDARTELAVQEALAELTRGRTTIAIAHRLSTLARADRLVVLEAGRIADSGTHAELAGRPGPYRDLLDAQAAQARAHAMRGGDA